MKNKLLFNFTINKANKTVNVEREFAAPLSLVWRAWTEPEILDRWWAPKPYKNVTKSMDFREGGTWLYYMVSPENEKHWCRNDYQRIAPMESFTALDAFCSEEGIVNKKMPRTQWTNTFLDKHKKTLVAIVATYENLADLEKVIAMGFKEGFAMALENLDSYLKEQVE